MGRLIQRLWTSPRANGMVEVGGDVVEVGEIRVGSLSPCGFYGFVVLFVCFRIAPAPLSSGISMRQLPEPQFVDVSVRIRVQPSSLVGRGCFFSILGVFVPHFVVFTVCR